MASSLDLHLSFRGTPYPLSRSPMTSLESLRQEVAAQLSLSLDTLKLIFKGKILTGPITLAQALNSDHVAPPYHIMVTGSEAAHVASIQAAKVDQSIAPFQRKVVASSLARPSSSSSSSSSSRYGFERIEVLQNLPNSEYAREILDKLASDPGIRHVMEKHQWRVGLLAEMYPKGKVAVDPVCVLGYNTNKGQSITLRLRTDDLRGFRYFETIKEVLFHELSHNVHSDHDDEFKALMSQLKREAAQGDWTKSAGRTVKGALAHHEGGGGELYQDYEIVDDSVHRFHEVNRLGGNEEGGSTAKQSGKEEPNRSILASAALTRARNSSPPRPEVKAKGKGSPEPQPKHPEPTGTLPTTPALPQEQKAADVEINSESFETNHPQQKTEAPLIDSLPEQPHRSPSPPQNEQEDPQDLLVAMGFQLEATQSALKRASGNIHEALQLLLSEGSEVPSNSIPSPERTSLPTSSSASTVPNSSEPAPMEIVDDDKETKESSMESAIPTSEIDERVVSLSRTLDHLLVKSSSQEARDALTTLITYLSNALKEPQNEKYRRIRASNQHFRTKVLDREGAVEILKTCGFYLEDDHWVLKRNDPGLLWLGKSILEEKLASLPL